MSGEWVDVEVRCRSEFQYAQEPRSIAWPSGEFVPVAKVMGAWRTPAGPGWRVLASGQLLELRYLQGQDRWQARLSPRSPAVRLARRRLAG